MMEKKKNVPVLRFPEFSGEWKQKKLGEVADIKTGPFGSALHQSDYVSEGTPIITVEHLGELGIVHENLPLVSDFDLKRLKSYLLQTNDIVFSRVGSVDRNSRISNSENGWLFSGRLLRIRFDDKIIDSAFVSNFFQKETTKQSIRSVAVGQTMASLNTEILKGIELYLTIFQEQQKIASILTSLDNKLQSLK
jgi:type I restriction enzyme S subunit